LIRSYGYACALLNYRVFPVKIVIMPFRVDLHVHSRYSGDNSSEPEESILKAIELKLHGIAFTEHYSYEASEPVERLREKYRDVITIFRGVEFSSAEGHCLIFGVNTDALPIKHASAEEVIRIVNASGGVVIPSHPYRIGNSMGDLLRRLEGLCALEGHNGCNMHAYNARAVETAKALSLPYTGGSDAHAPEEVGLCYTEFDDRFTVDDLVSRLRKGCYRGVDARARFRSFSPH
jgi:predicted metal-dependent phosphoesterase TrpH